PSLPPQAGFIPSSTIVCSTDSIQFTNSSTNAASYQWIFPGGSPSSSNLASPWVYYAATGTYAVTLIATGPGGVDTLVNSFLVVVNQPPVAAFIMTADTVTLPNAMVGFTNQSQNADGYAWYFGDGNFSNGVSPWNIYSQAGTYNVMLIASTGGCINDTLFMTLVVLGPNSIDQVSAEEIKYYPNPAGNQFLFYTSGDGGKLYWMDAVGKQVAENTILRGSNTINVSEFAQGVYVIKYVGISGNVFTQRIEIMRP
ncbi:MAG: PKD domain-containing protein, partial [Flavobacteriales bacterium]